MPLGAQPLVLITGDSSLDITLRSLNVEASLDVGTFTAELSAGYGVSGAELRRWIAVERLQPAEVYMVLELSKIARRPPATVLAVYRRNPGKGWGVVARELGIRPGSAEFKEWKTDADDRTRKVKTRRQNETATRGRPRD